MPSVLVVDAEAKRAAAVTEALNGAGHSARSVPTGQVSELKELGIEQA